MNTQAPFARMNGLGNQILVIDMRGRKDRVTPDAAIALASDERTRFDQIMAIYDARLNGTDFHIEIMNCDGSQAEACGNGTRCVVQALADLERYHPERFKGPQEAEPLLVWGNGRPLQRQEVQVVLERGT